MARKTVLLLALLVPLGCSSEDPGDDFGIDDVLSPIPLDGKADSAGKPGPLVATNTSATQVWVAKNKWEDTGTPAANAAGLAWGANSGLSWDQKYRAWIDSLQEVQSSDGYTTFRLTTPWGKTLPAPVLECAESAMFLRASFAAWYNLPFFLETQDSHGNRVYFGHFGIRTAAGRYAGTPNFAQAYKDYSGYTANDLATRGWPKDAVLRTKSAAGGSDEQPAIAPGAHFGAYLDEAHLNKRAGYFIIYLENFLGSANLADSVNTYNLVPEAIQAGDLQMHRWQKNGIGDTKVLKTVSKNSDGNLVAQVMSGSMPRRQPLIYDEVSSKMTFTEDDAGGPGTNWEGDEYWKLGGGVKRWRVTKNIGGRWTNTWMAADEASWINSTDKDRLTARPDEFNQILGEVSPQEKLAGLERQIADAREHLMQYPASCAARSSRERAFHELYDLAPRLGTTREAIDHSHRVLADYVFAELSYGEAKTCCWDSSTSDMADIVMQRAEEEQQGVCRIPTVFKWQSDGYQGWSSYAAAHGRAAQWRAWSEDEPCAQRNTTLDAETDHEAQAWCPR